jgi:hypothetical protein
MAGLSDDFQQSLRANARAGNGVGRSPFDAV